ncbi:LytR/AlgR family response regulator transcription factor [Pseudoalteromonas sp. H105]|uniref:LytR/AlgR family response regulator transcription factor n=1 Tax=Pseudoalteromonas sp. H105 TaxID=1348393 RepID=UPI000A60BD1E|nr:response regulator transcription factor [Pseudoalteromonas sp. H105]
MITAAVIEDSRLARHGLIRLLAAHDEINVIGDADNVSSALELIEAHSPDVLFLDIHMPGESGFDLLEKLNYSPQVIFTTAYNEHALRSFDYNVVDYLLKPINKSRLSDAIYKLTINNQNTQHDVSEPLANNTEETNGFTETEVTEPKLTMTSKVFIKDGELCHLIPLADIDYFESCKNYTRVFFGNKNAYIKKPLSSILNRLPESDFLQANRQQIINLNAVSQTDLGVNDNCEILLNHITPISISRRNMQQLKSRLGF